MLVRHLPLLCVNLICNACPIFLCRRRLEKEKKKREIVSTNTPVSVCWLFCVVTESAFLHGYNTQG
jgi:hypothetical protein